MTLEQLKSLNDDEIALALYIVNVHAPSLTGVEIPTQGLTWFKKGALEKKIGESFPALKKEAHPVFSSLLNKLGIPHEIKYEQPPLPASCSISASVSVSI